MSWMELVAGIIGMGLVFAFGAACAFVLGSFCLRIVVGAVTRRQDKVNGPTQIRPDLAASRVARILH